MKTFKQLIGKDLPITDEEDINELSLAQRRAKKQAYLKKTMAKYGQAAKMGIPASQVNQRRNTPTTTPKTADEPCFHEFGDVTMTSKSSLPLGRRTVQALRTPIGAREGG